MGVREWRVFVSECEYWVSKYMCLGVSVYLILPAWGE